MVRAFAATRGKSIPPVNYSIDEISVLPAWSADGRKLAFSRFIYPGYYMNFFAGEEIEAPPWALLHAIDSDGSGLRTLAGFDDERRVNNLSWSPREEDILLTSHVPATFADSRVFVVDAENGGGPRKIAEGVFASWAPDGSRIAVIDFSDEYLFTVTPDGTERQVLVRRDDDGELKAVQ